MNTEKIWHKLKNWVSSSALVASPPASDTLRTEPVASAQRGTPKIDGTRTNLVYQDFGDSKGGSDSDRKLAAIQLPPLAGKRFLDLGCNAGFFCAHADEQGAASTLGIDVSDRVIDLAKERYPNLSFSSGGWDKFPEGTFDVVICLSAIHYAKAPAVLANDIGSALSEDGVFVLEGGLFDAGQAEAFSDVRIPVWREVGDKCFHLSLGYLQNHLLAQFQWEVLGPSNNQGGDPLDRYVTHAKQWRATTSPVPVHQLCLMEYASNVAISGPTIVQGQPAYSYVRRLAQGNAEDGGVARALSEILANEAERTLLVADIKEALGANADGLVVRWPEEVSGRDLFESALCGYEITPQIVS